jgi:PAS domain S-box-containing protein
VTAVEERALADLRGRALDATDLSVTISDPRQPDNPLVHVNPSFERITGYRAEEVIGRNCRFLQCDATDPNAVEELRVALAEERPASVLLLNQRKDGTPFWNELTVSPLRGDHGEVTHFVGVQRDVTARVEAEQGRELHHAREQHARAEAEAAQGRLAYLAEASSALDTSLDVQTTLARLGRLAVPRLADTCLITLAGDDAAGQPPVFRTDLRDDAGRAVFDTPAGRAAVATLVGLGGAGTRASVHYGTSVRAVGYTSALVVPLNARGRHLGTAVLLRDKRPVPNEQELLLASELGRRSAMALDNAHRYAERDHIARVLQESLLPPVLPTLPGAELATRYVPVGSGTEVGGDFYDVFDTGRSWGLVIGDVCGKGAAAAAVTGLVRHTARVAAMQDGRPAQVLRVLNKALLGAELGDRFVTAAYVDYVPTPQGARLHLALGGHPHPVVLRGDRAEIVGETGTLLGALEDVDLPETRIQLQPGDAIVLVTDGVIEAAGPQGRLDEADLLRSVARAAGRSAEAIASTVVSMVLEHTGGSATDDLAVVVLRIPTSN